MADSFLVLVPHKTLHGTISILIQRPKLATNVGKMGAVKSRNVQACSHASQIHWNAKEGRKVYNTPGSQLG